MILKVQQSLYSSDSSRSVLVYNEERTIHLLITKRRFVRKVAKKLGSRAKGYFEATVDGESVNLIKEVEPQPW